MSDGPTYTWATATHPGRVRADNEDAVYPDGAGRGDGPQIVAVADGMGGHAAGDVASRMAIETAAEEDSDPAGRVRAANQRVVQASRERAELAGMGTTLTLAALRPQGEVTIAHVGDSRAYLLRDGRLEQLTTDHSLMAEYLASGRIEPEDVPNHPQRSVITRALGMSADVEVDLFEERLETGDRLLLCSDGLSSMIDEEHITELLGRDERIEELAWSLIEAANQAGGEDNISVVVVDLS